MPGFALQAQSVSAMSTAGRSLPDVLRGLVLLHGLSASEAAIRAGISPGAVAATTTRTARPLQNWLLFVAVLGGRLTVAAQGQEWAIALPRPRRPLLDREWQAWRLRRRLTFANGIRSHHARLSQRATEAKADDYRANEEARLRTRLAALAATPAALSGHLRADGLRSGLQALATRAGVLPEELALLSGVSLSACQLALGQRSDGRLATAHRLLSACNARFSIVAASGRIDIALCPPGPWRPGMPAADVDEDQDDGESTARVAVAARPHRSRLAPDEILRLYDEGISMGDIARKAGVSRQRVHRIAMDAGRTHRRVLAREERMNEGTRLLRDGEHGTSPLPLG